MAGGGQGKSLACRPGEHTATELIVFEDAAVLPRALLSFKAPPPAIPRAPRPLNVLSGLCSIVCVCLCVFLCVCRKPGRGFLHCFVSRPPRASPGRRHRARLTAAAAHRQAASPAAPMAALRVSIGGSGGAAQASLS